MFIKKLFVSAVAIFCLGIANAQVQYLTAADKYFAKGDYYSASQYYEKYLSGKNDKDKIFNPYAVSAVSSKKSVVTPGVGKDQVIYKLAESYRLLNFHEKALPNYQQLKDNPAFPLARFHYARSLRALNNHTEAEAEFNTFLASYTENDINKEEAQRELENIKYINRQLAKKDINLYKLNKAPGALNDTGATYAPVWIGENNLLLTSTRPVKDDKDNLYTNRIYIADYANGSVGSVTQADLKQPKEIHQGAATMLPNGNTMFFSRWTVGEGKKSSSIYSSTKVGDKWGDPVAVDILNAAGSNSQQPYVTPDGKYLLFSSDRSGGAGGFDIWYAPLDGIGVPTAVNNLAAINTRHDEQAPSYHAASNTLVFSTNGRVGMGGYDFFYSKGDVTNLAEPVNFGYPVNSVKDDIYFASRGTARNILEDVLLSSDRDAACCLELFALHKDRVPKQLTGTVIDCETQRPLSGVTVTIVDTINGKTISNLTTNASGSYSFTLDEFQQLRASASLTGYMPGNVQIMTPADLDESSMTTPVICLNLIPVEPITVDNVYYDFNKSELRPESFPALDELVSMMNDDKAMQIELGAHTDSKGTDDYNMDLSEARAKSVIDYLVGKGIDASRLTYKGYGESQPIAENENADGSDNPEGRQKNRRTEFRVIKN